MFALETAQLAADRPAPALTPSLPGGRKRWRLRSSPYIGKLAHSGLPDLVARILEARGVGSLPEAQLFLGGTGLTPRDRFLIPGFSAAVARLQRAIAVREPVIVFGDFDVDGITSTATLTETINDLGGVARPYIPHREREGYGLNLAAVDHLAAEGARVILTCDCGTSSVLEVDRANALGVDVVIVDHHLQPEPLPAAVALLNPRLRGSEYPFADYATAGLAYRLAEALYGSCRRPFPEERYLDLATLGTIADMVPLLDENRAMVRNGLGAIGASKRPGLRALMDVASVVPGEVTAESVSFALAPRLNAAGRLDDARLALDLLMTRDSSEARALAVRIDGLNRERQQLTRAAQASAREIVATKGEAPASVVGHPDFHKGVVGLVASRLVEIFGRPAFVYQLGAEESRGSCRSIAGYDIVAGLTSCGDLFERFGGHRQAGGFTVRNDRLAEMEERLIAHASEALAGQDLSPSLEIDAEWPLGSVRGQEIKFMGKLGPFGMGNPDVTLLSRGVTVLDASTVGAEGRHLRLKLKDGNVSWPAIAFDFEDDVPPPGTRIDVVYTIAKDRYRGSYPAAGSMLQLMVEDFAPSSGA